MICKSILVWIDLLGSCHIISSVHINHLIGRFISVKAWSFCLWCIYRRRDQAKGGWIILFSCIWNNPSIFLFGIKVTFMRGVKFYDNLSHRCVCLVHRKKSDIKIFPFEWWKLCVCFFLKQREKSLHPFPNKYAPLPDMGWFTPPFYIFLPYMLYPSPPYASSSIFLGK